MPISPPTVGGQVKLYHPGTDLVIGFQGWVSRFVSLNFGADACGSVLAPTHDQYQEDLPGLDNEPPRNEEQRVAELYTRELGKVSAKGATFDPQVFASARSESPTP
jgi:hypothetical protein